MSSPARHARPMKKPGPWLRQAGRENALYDPETNAVHFLNPTALAIWDLCDGETEPEEMIEAICEISGQHRDVIAEDVERTLHRLEHLGLITWES
jgi:PqqD family protein of HPr-rel-A system